MPILPMSFLLLMGNKLWISLHLVFKSFFKAQLILCRVHSASLTSRFFGNLLGSKSIHTIRSLSLILLAVSGSKLHFKQI